MHTLISADGTALAYEVTGGGPPVVLVSGALSDHAVWDAVAPKLAPHATVFAMDRRGRGDSEDRPGTAVDDEIDDVLALLAEAGPGAVLVGHSSGALLALRAAARTAALSTVVAYEPPPYPDGVPPMAGRLRELTDAGDLEAALSVFFSDLVGLPAEVVNAQRETPAWHAALALAHSTPYDAAIAEQGLPAEEATRIHAPVRMLLGSESAPAMAGYAHHVASALPDAEVRILRGQQHYAMTAAPDLVAQEILPATGAR